MKRFVDLRGQDIGSKFAWYDTVTDKFESFSGDQVFDTWDDFVFVYDGDELERYRGLCPLWVFKKPTEGE